MSDIKVGSVWVHFSGMVAIVDSFDGCYVGYHPLDNPDSKRSCSLPVFTKYFIEAKEDEPDMVNHPPHYKDASGIECIEVTKYMMFCGGSCFKYLYRCGNKWDDIEDLKKAAWYANQSRMLEENVGAIIIPSIRHVARYRSGNIADAMKLIARDMWADAKRAIEREIARLEGEAADD